MYLYKHTHLYLYIYIHIYIYTYLYLYMCLCVLEIYFIFYMPLYIAIDGPSFKPKFCVLFSKNKIIYFGLGHEGIHECFLFFKKTMFDFPSRWCSEFTPMHMSLLQRDSKL